MKVYSSCKTLQVGSWSPFLLTSSRILLQLLLLLVEASIAPTFQISSALPVNMLNVFFSYENLLLARLVLKPHHTFEECGGEREVMCAKSLLLTTHSLLNLSPPCPLPRLQKSPHGNENASKL